LVAEWQQNLQILYSGANVGQIRIVEKTKIPETLCLSRFREFQ